MPLEAFAEPNDDFKMIEFSMRCRNSNGSNSEPVELSLAAPNLNVYDEETKPLESAGQTVGSVYGFMSGQTLTPQLGSAIDYPTVRLFVCASEKGKSKNCIGLYLPIDKKTHAFDIGSGVVGLFNCTGSLNVVRK